MQDLQGIIQLVVSLKTTSVEFSMETGDNRYSKTLNSDMSTASEILRKGKECGEFSDGDDDREFLKRKFAELVFFVEKIDEMTRFETTYGGNKVYVPVREISFITIKTTGIFREIQKELD